MIGVAAALAGAAPRFAPFAWGVLLVTFIVTEIGPLTELPSWVMDLSPFTHLSSLPGGVVRGRPGRGAHPARGSRWCSAGSSAYRRRDVA